MKKQRVILGGIILFLMLNMTIRIWAATPPIAVSDSYRNGQYYTKLCNTLDQYANASQRDRFIQIALSQKGYKASSTSGINSGDGNALGGYCEYMYQINPGQYGNNWCAAFVSWCARMAGLPENVVPTSAAVGTFRDQVSSFGTAHRLWSNDFSQYIDYKPEPGDLILHMPYNESTGANYNAWTPSAHIAIIASVSSTRASDGGWTITTIERGGSVSSGVTMTTLGNTVWYRTVSTKVNSGSGSHLYQMIIHPNWQDTPRDTTAPIISNAKAMNVNTTGFTVSCKVTDNVEVSRVRFAVWTPDKSANGTNQDDLEWIDAVKAADGTTWSANVLTSKHNNELGCRYITDIYAYDTSGNEAVYSKVASAYVVANVPVPDKTAPVISNVKVTNRTNVGYTVTCDVTDNVGVTSVKFPTWNTKGTSEGCTWYVGTKGSGNSWSFTFKGAAEEGNYCTHIYAADAAGNTGSSAAPVTFVDKTAPVITNIKSELLSDGSGFKVTCDIADKSAISKVEFPTWTTSGGQDDLIKPWQTGTYANGKASFVVKRSAHNNEKGEYLTHIYATDACGNRNDPARDSDYIFTRIKETGPSLENWSITASDADTYTVTCTVTDSVGVARVEFPTWTTNGGKDDLANPWPQGAKNGNVYTYVVKRSEHNNEFGEYCTHIYAWDVYGNHTARSLSHVFSQECVHSWIPGDMTPETCITDGKIEYTCSKCGKSYEEVIPASGIHVYGDPEIKQPTCSESGTKTYKCLNCDHKKVEAGDPATGDHVWDGGDVIKEASCVELGEIIYTCEYCGVTRTEELPLTKHAHTELRNNRQATCYATGYSGDLYCLDCGNIVSQGEEISKTDHQRIGIKGERPATCLEEGYTGDRYCLDCETVLEEGKTIPIATHTPVDIEAEAPTCKDAGRTEGKKCSVCGEILEAPKEIPPTGQHTWDAGTVTTQPTTTATGVKTFTCTVCGETKTEPIAKLTPEPAAPKAPEPDPVLGNVTSLDGKAKSLPENGDPAGSTFSILQVKGKKVKKTSITIAWKAVPKATGYVIYGAPCGSKYAKLKDIMATSFTQSGLKKGRYYKYFVSAHDKNGNILASSKTIHIATSGGKKGNTKSIKLNKKKATLKKGKTVKLKATLKNGKLKVSKHRKVAFESDNPKVATVSKSGKVKAVGKGKCIIYAYAQNGVFAKCKITVK